MWYKDLLSLKNTRVSFSRPISSYWKIRILWGAITRNKKFQLKIKNVAITKKPYLNVGCGLNIEPNFLNLDYNWLPGIEICADISKGIPLPNESMRGIYTEHCLEHILFSECCFVLKEFYRILKKGCTLRIIVPDAELYIKLYNEHKTGKSPCFPYSEETEGSKYATPMMHLNRVFRGYEHKFAYDEETLNALLKNTGFINIRRESFLRGRNPKLLIDTDGRKDESLYIEASK